MATLGEHSSSPAPASLTLSTLGSPEKHSSSPALSFTPACTGTVEVYLRGSIPTTLPQPKTLSLETHSCSTLPPLASPLSQAISCLPPQSSISTIDSTDRIGGARGNPYPRAPLAHCSGHGLSAWRGVKPQPDGGETMAAIDQGDMLHLSLSRLLGVV